MQFTRTSLTLIALLTACGGQKGGLTVFNTPPSVTIVSPPDGTQLQEGETVTFEARVDDAENDDGELEIRWSSDLGGEFPGPFLLEGGVTSLTTASLDGGFNHVITVTAIDPSAEADSASITVTVEDLPDAPSIEMARPIDGETGVEGVAFAFSALVSDPKEEASALTVTFSTDQAEGAFCTPEVDAAGEARCEAVLGIGAHVLTFLVEDGEGKITGFGSFRFNDFTFTGEALGERSGEHVLVDVIGEAGGYTLTVRVIGEADEELTKIDGQCGFVDQGAPYSGAVNMKRAEDEG